MRYADLHVHTFYSDSTFSPDEVISCANGKGLDAIAICDHDCVDGIEPCMESAKNKAIDIEVVPGIELTSEKDDTEIHMLGYFLDWRNPEFLAKLKKIQDERVDRVFKMAEKLQSSGIDIDPEEVLNMSGRGSVGRLHVARAMLKTKKVKTFEEAFSKYIGFMKPCYVRHAHMTPREAIGLIRSVNGVAVLAHPSTVVRDDFIPEFVEDGQKGIEVYHIDHTKIISRHYEDVARRYGLIATGGSDCHGLGKHKVLMGSVRVPYTVVEELKKESLKRP